MPLRSCSSSVTGFCAILDLQLPACLSEGNHALPVKGSYGFHDGLHNLVWKEDRTNDGMDLVNAGIIQCELAEGFLYVFPKWVKQMTYPFRGQGDRVWCSAVVECRPPGGVKLPCAE